MPILDSVLDVIGATPLVRLRRVAADCPAEIVGKLEACNPGGSVKDRIAVAMIDAAELDGTLAPGATIVEATAGNTGVGLAMTAAVRGYRCVFVMPEKMSREKEALLRAYGAEVIRTANAPLDDPENFLSVAVRLADENGWFLPDQFANPANPEMHEATTGPEIWEDSDGRVDALVAGAGTGGTLTGAGRFLKRQKPDVSVVLADPVGSTLGGGPDGCYRLEGIGSSRIPPNYDPAVVDEAIKVTDDEAFAMCRRLATEEGLLVGGAAGCAVVAALAWAARSENAGKLVVAILPDTGRNYLSGIFGA